MTKMDYALSPGLGPAGLQPGWLESLRFPDPAAGANFSATVPGEYEYRIDALRFDLVTSAAVANRIPVIDFVHPDGYFQYEVSAANTLPAGSAVSVYAMSQYAPSLRTATGGNYVALPDTVLKPMWKIQVNIGAIDVADQISNVRLRVWRYPSSMMVPYVEG